MGEKIEATKQLPRLRLAKDIDLSKAKKNCKGCGGTGVKEEREIDDPENEGETVKVPVICKCVSRNQGVKRDQLDEAMENVAKQVEDGTFAKDMAKDIMELPLEEQGRAIVQMKKKAASAEESPEVRRAAFSVLRLLQN